VNSEKIVAFDALAGVLEVYRAQGKTVVHSHGVFDLLHIGHIRYLQKAKQLGDVLLVTITPDHLVNKGPHRPVFDQTLRAAALAALACVDHVCVNIWPTAAETIAHVKPSVFVKGAEYRDHKTPELLREEKVAAGLGVAVEFIEELTSSSSHLINNHLSPFSEEADQYLLGFRQTHSAHEILAPLQAAQKMRVLVVGEAIIDEYHTCSMLGQSMKATNIVTRFHSHQRYLGGAPAVANHLASFCQEVCLVAMLGADQTQEDWVRNQLRGNIQPRFIHQPNAPTIVKRQFREAYFGTPLFEIDYLNQEPLATAESDALRELLEREAPQFDLVVAADYGHGMLDAAAVRVLCDVAKFLAVTTQANAANVGYHTISKYCRANYFSLSEHELRLDRKSPAGGLAELLEQVRQELEAENAAVTIGNRGCFCLNAEQRQCTSPALATNVVDRFGAGEAFFALTAIAARAGATLEELAFLGNVAGAEVVAVEGNAAFLDKLAVERHVESLLK